MTWSHLPDTSVDFIVRHYAVVWFLVAC